MKIRHLATGFKAVAVALTVGVSGCANMMADGPQRAELLRANALDPVDTYEATNRAIFNANEVIYDYSLRPLAGAYLFIVPAVIRNRITAGISNLEEPNVFINDLLQARVESAYRTFGRFLVNSTLGVGGIFDVATLGGLKRQTGDFGQTLFVWGVSSGAYRVIPVLGPSTPRDAFGKLVDAAIDPGGYAIARVGGFFPSLGIGIISGVEGIDGLSDVEAGSLDPYLRLRSIYLQKRAADLSDAVGIPVGPQISYAGAEAKPAPVKHSKRLRKKKKAT